MDFFIIDNNENIIANLSADSTGTNTPVLEAIVSEKISSYDELVLKIPADSEDARLIKENQTIVFEDIRGWREYTIHTIEDLDGAELTKTITADLSSIELANDIVEKELRNFSQSPTTLLTEVLKGTRWTIGYIEPSLVNQALGEDTEHLSALEVIDIISTKFKAEVAFGYAMQGNKITKRTVNLYKQVGQNNGKRFEIDKDITSIKRTVEVSNLKTAIIPFGKEPEEGKKRLDIKDVVWSKASGDPVDKPKGQTWIGNPDALAQWGVLNPDGSKRHRFIAQEIDVDTPAQLASMGWVHLGIHDKPKVSYEVDAIDLYTITGDEDLKHEYVGLGDTVLAVDNYFAETLTAHTRTVELERDLLNPLNNKFVFGDSKQYFTVGSISDSVSDLSGELDKVKTDIEIAYTSADGKSTVFQGTIEPVKAAKGDLWYRPHPSIVGETQMVIFNGTTWDIVSDTSDLDSMGKEVGKIQLETEAAKKEADAAIIKADQAIKDAGFAGLGSAEAKSNAVAALEKANTAKTNAGTALTTAQTGLTNSATALDKAGQALTKATATETATGSLTTSYDALTKTVGLKADKTELNTVNGTVTQHDLDIKANATAIGVKADKSVVDIINKTVTAHSLSIKATADSLASKAEKTLVDSLSGTVATHGTTLIQTAKDIALKADSTEVNAIKGTVNTHSTAIAANASGLLVKAEKSEVNTISGKVTANSTAISVNAKDIGLRLTSTQVESAITAKKYVNETTFNATSSGLTASIASTDLELGKSNTRITNVEATANGLQTTVKNKAEQSQVTQIASQVASKVEGSVYNTKMTQLDSAINLRLTTGQVNESILADKKVKDTRNTNQTPAWYQSNYPAQLVEEFKQRTVLGVSGTATFGLLTTKVMYADASGGKITQVFSSADGVFTRDGTGTVWTAWTRTAEVENLVAQINLSPKGVLIQGKNIQLDGDVAMDNAFVNRIKAIEVIADKITSGTFNGAKMNIINLNAKSMTSGTLTGANFGLNLDIGTATFTNPYNGDTLLMNQARLSFFNGNQGRHLAYTDEGLQVYPDAINTGTAKNTSIMLIGGGQGSHQYIKFLNGSAPWIEQRITALDNRMYVGHGTGGGLYIRTNGLDETTGRVVSGRYLTSHSSGQTLELYANSLSTPNDGNRNIYMVPNGTGSLVVGNSAGTRWNVHASDFVKVSSRDTKTDIKPITSKGLDVIGRLLPVSYKKKDKLAQGIDEIELGFIAEDSLEVAEPEGKGIYDSHITAYLVKGMQELVEEVAELKREKENAE